MSREINRWNMRDRIYCARAGMPATCACDHCQPRVEALLVSLMNQVDEWVRLNDTGKGPNARWRMEQLSINSMNTMNQLRRLHHRPTHHEVIA